MRKIVRLLLEIGWVAYPLHVCTCTCICMRARFTHVCFTACYNDISQAWKDARVCLHVTAVSLARHSSSARHHRINTRHLLLSLSSSDAACSRTMVKESSGWLFSGIRFQSYYIYSKYKRIFFKWREGVGVHIGTCPFSKHFVTEKAAHQCNTIMNSRGQSHYSDLRPDWATNNDTGSTAWLQVQWQQR